MRDIRHVLFRDNSPEVPRLGTRSPPNVTLPPAKRLSRPGLAGPGQQCDRCPVAAATQRLQSFVPRGAQEPLQTLGEGLTSLMLQQRMQRALPHDYSPVRPDGRPEQTQRGVVRVALGVASWGRTLHHVVAHDPQAPQPAGETASRACTTEPLQPRMQHAGSCRLGVPAQRDRGLEHGRCRELQMRAQGRRAGQYSEHARHNMSTRRYGTRTDHGTSDNEGRLPLRPQCVGSACAVILPEIGGKRQCGPYCVCRAHSPRVDLRALPRATPRRVRGGGSLLLPAPYAPHARRARHRTARRVGDDGRPARRPRRRPPDRMPA